MIQKIVIISLLVSVLSAQKLTLDDAISMAINTHPDIKQFTLQVKKSQSGVHVAQADYLPQVNLNGEYNPSKTYVLPANGVFNTIDGDGYQVGATLHQKIWDFKRTIYKIDAASKSIEISKLSLKDAKAYLAYKVKLQYELIVVQREAMIVREKDLQAKDALYKQALALVKQGMKTSADATRFLSSFYVAQDNLAISTANFDKARNILSIYINENIDKDIVLDNTMLRSITYADTNTILHDSPSLKALEKEMKRSLIEYKSTKSSHYGSLDFVASYNYQDTLNQYDSTLLGVTLDIPLYSGGRTSALVEQALIDRQTSQAGYSSKALSLKEEVSSLIIDINRYEKTLTAKKAQLDAAAHTSQLLEARYKEGLATYIEVLDASALQLDAKLGLLSAHYERSSALHRLEYLQGKI